MKIKKITLMLALVLCMGFVLPVYADDATAYNIHKNECQPRWVDTDSVDIMLEKTNSGLEASVVVIPNNNNRVMGTLYLQKYKNGNWTTIMLWRFSGKDYTEVSKTYSTNYGKYRAKVKVKVGSDSITMYSFEEEIN